MHLKINLMYYNQRKKKNKGTNVIVLSFGTYQIIELSGRLKGTQTHAASMEGEGCKDIIVSLIDGMQPRKSIIFC